MSLPGAQRSFAMFSTRKQGPKAAKIKAFRETYSLLYLKELFSCTFVRTGVYTCTELSTGEFQRAERTFSVADDSPARAHTLAPPLGRGPPSCALAPYRVRRVRGQNRP